MLNYPRIIYNKWGTYPLVHKMESFFSNFQKKIIFLKTNLEPICFTDNAIDLGQATHPDLIYDEKKGEYLMTVSNYPFGIERLENSYVLRSRDGIHFSNILSGAVDTYNGVGDSHFSDGDMIFDGEQYSLYYRFCERDSDMRDIIYISNSFDGIVWSLGKKIITAERDGILSPAVVFYNKKYIMYYIELNEHGSTLYRCDSNTNQLERFADNRTKMKVRNMPRDMMLWHINVSNEGKKLYGLFTLSTGLGGANARLFYAEGNLDSNEWEIKMEIHPMIKSKYIKKVYRSALVKTEEIWYLYLAVCTKNDCWYLARKRFFENE